MNRARLLAIALLLFSAALPTVSRAEGALPTGLNVYEVKSVPKERLYIDCQSATEGEILTLRRRLMEEGAEKVNLFFLDVIVCEIPVGLDPRDVIHDGRFSYIEESRIDTNRPSNVSANVIHTKQSYELARELASAETHLAPPDDFQDRVLVVSPDIIEKSKWRQVDGVSGAVVEERNIAQNAEFMIGDILIRTIYPESSGQGVNTEDWSDQDLKDARQGVVSAALAFQEKFNYLPLDFVFTAEERVPTRYEPIRHTLADDATTWIPDVLANLGYNGLGIHGLDSQ
jgi:hypothetical protein